MEIDDARLRALQELSRSTQRAEADQARTILLSAKGWSSGQIARAFGVTADSVRDWRRAFARGGVEGLRGAEQAQFDMRQSQAMRPPVLPADEPVASELRSIMLSRPDGTQHEFFHRGTPADLGVVQQVLVKQEYSFHRLRRGAALRRLYDDAVTAGRTPLILDAGANIGASVVHWAFTFPQAQITAWEPAHDNFELLARNTEGLNVDLRGAAIGARDGSIALVDPGEGAWGYRTVAGGEGVRVPVEAASRIIAEKLGAGLVPFVAKIDIEGGEAELFSRDIEWIDRFPLLIVELHDWLLPGTASSRTLLRCLADRNRDFLVIGENIFSIRN